MASVDFDKNEILFDKMSSNSKVWMSHGDEVGIVGDEWIEIAQSDNGVVAAIKNIKNRDLKNNTEFALYKSANTDVIGLLVEKISGISLRDWVLTLVESAGFEDGL